MENGRIVTPYFTSIRAQIISRLSQAEKKVSVAVCWFTNNSLLDVLCSKLDMNIEVELVILDDYINGNPYGCDFQKFISKGGELYLSSVDNPMHSKYCIIDDVVLINGSYNWTYFAETKNEENIVVFEKCDELIAAFNENFERLKSVTKKVTSFKQKPIEYFEQYLNNISVQNAFSTKNMLSEELFIKAVETNNKNYYEAATRIVPDNVQWQKKAVELHWNKPIRLKRTLSEGVVGDKVHVIFPMGTTLPAECSHTYCTTSDYQKEMYISVLSGENLTASKNMGVTAFYIYGIPLLKAGEAQFPTEYKLTIDGKLHIKKHIHDTGSVTTKIIDIRVLGLLENK